MIDGEHTADGIRLRPAAVRRHLELRCESEAIAARVAEDLRLLDCEAEHAGCSVRVSGSRAFLAEIESYFT